MPTAYFGRFAVVAADGLYVVVDRVAMVPARLSDGNAAIFVIARDACLWAICRTVVDGATATKRRADA
jgi:hypothetical protein